MISDQNSPDWREAGLEGWNYAMRDPRSARKEGGVGKTKEMGIATLIQEKTHGWGMSRRWGSSPPTWEEGFSPHAPSAASWLLFKSKFQVVRSTGLPRFEDCRCTFLKKEVVTSVAALRRLWLPSTLPSTTL